MKEERTSRTIDLKRLNELTDACYDDWIATKDELNICYAECEDCEAFEGGMPYEDGVNIEECIDIAKDEYEDEYNPEEHGDVFTIALACYKCYVPNICGHHVMDTVENDAYEETLGDIDFDKITDDDKDELSLLLSETLHRWLLLKNSMPTVGECFTSITVDAKNPDIDAVRKKFDKYNTKTKKGE